MNGKQSIYSQCKAKIYSSLIENRRTELIAYCQCEAEMAAIQHKAKRSKRYVRWLSEVRSANAATINRWHDEYTQRLSLVSTEPEPESVQLSLF